MSDTNMDQERAYNPTEESLWTRREEVTSAERINFQMDAQMLA